MPRCLLLLLLALPLEARAQLVRGTVRDRTGAPLGGVVVVLADSVENAVGRALTENDGSYRLTAARAGTVTLRALRVGFVPARSAPFVVGAGETVEQSLTMDGARVQLAAVRVVGKSSCRATAADGEIFEVWEQALASLSASTITGATRGLTTSTLKIDQALDARGRVLDQTLAMRTDNVLLPWRALPPDTLRKHGYVWLGRDDALTYNAPGIDVFVAPTFLVDHCVKLAQSKDTSEIGIAFEPAKERFRVAEISGTLWLDRASAALRRAEFTFGTVPGLQPSPVPAGGSMRFARLPSGGVVIEQWELRMPETVRDGASSRARVDRVQTTGGQLIAVRRGSDTLYRRPPVRLVGEVRDSTSNQLVPGARLRLTGTRATAVADASGRFAFDDVLPGEYTLAVRTPSLDSIRAERGQPVLVREGAPTVVVRVPTARQMAQTLCGANFANGSASRGALFGSLLAVGDTIGPEGVSVVADWVERSTTSASALLQGQGKRLETRTDATGSYRLCGVPTETALTVRAFPREGRSAPVQTRLAPDQRFATVPLQYDRARAAVASFSGRVLADSTRQPVEGAEVSVAGAATPARTNAQGEFRIADIPAGAQEVTVRRVGFAAYTGQVTFAANDEEQREVVLRPLTLLDSVVTTARPNDIRMSEFEDHRRLGLGWFLDRAAIERQEYMTLRQAVALAPALFQVNGRYAVSSRYNNPRRAKEECSEYGQARLRAAGMRGVFYFPDITERRQGVLCSCYAKVYMDGRLENRGTPRPPFDLRQVTLTSLEAVEWYNSPADTPGQYSGLDSPCGVLVLHTRRLGARSP
ncbi:MAG: carboxypeptidase regulatory-like domain-containing protein [Gemmatimonadetes bacterium]|nr:carboxypeptidase regulatory-like domain-containing protein [Gemmatimonadota bacterium]